jgi:hypothetical protein
MKSLGIFYLNFFRQIHQRNKLPTQAFSTANILPHNMSHVHCLLITV